ncbi:murein L,D-transpeptidase, partial [Acinetobacter baumannii]
CIRMRNEEIIELFDLVSEDALVYLSEQSLT